MASQDGRELGRGLGRELGREPCVELAVYCSASVAIGRLLARVASTSKPFLCVLGKGKTNGWGANSYGLEKFRIFSINNFFVIY